MHAASISLRWTIILILIVLGGVAILTAAEADAAPDGLQLWNEDFTRKASAARDGGKIGITATDLTTSGGTNFATVSDPTNPSDYFQLTIYDDGTNDDTMANDGIYTGLFTVCDDQGTSGSCTDAASGTIDIAEGNPVSVLVDLDNDGSYSQVTIGTDYHGPGLQIPFEGGYVSGRLTIIVTIIVEGDAEIDPTSVTYSLDFGPAVPFDLIAPLTWRAIIDTYNLTDGPHKVTINAGDVAGNLDSSTIDFIADNTVPDIFHIGSVIDKNGDILIDTSVRDQYLDCSTVRWRWDEGDWNAPVLDQNISFVSCFTMTIPYDDLIPGEHEIMVNARDLANNSMTRITRFTLPEQRTSSLSVVLPDDFDPSTMVSCSTMAIPIDLDHDELVPLDLDLFLSVDGLLTDNESIRLLVDTPATVELVWPDTVYGKHDVNIEIIAPNSSSGDTPIVELPIRTDELDYLWVLPPDIELFHDDDNVSEFRREVERLHPGGAFLLDGLVDMNVDRGEYRLSIDLVVDGDIVDTALEKFKWNESNTDFELVWPDITTGQHVVEVELFLPDIVGTDEPVDVAPVLNIDGGPFIVGPPQIYIDKFERPLTVDQSTLRPGDTLTISPWLGIAESRGVHDVIVELVVDGKVVDHLSETLRGNTTGTDVTLHWEGVTQGEHEIELRLFALDFEHGLIPIDTKPVTNLGGGAVKVEPLKIFIDEDQEPSHVNASNIRPGGWARFRTWIGIDETSGVHDFTLELVVDGKVVDKTNDTVEGNSAGMQVGLWWSQNVTPGEHEVEYRLYSGNDATGKVLIETKKVTDLDGGPIVVDPLRIFINTLFQPLEIDTSKVKPGDNLTITPWLANKEALGHQNVTVELWVDGKFVTWRHKWLWSNTTNETVELPWPNVTSGEHDVEIRLYKENKFGLKEELLETKKVTGLRGAPFIIGSATAEPPGIFLGTDGEPISVPASELRPGDDLIVDVPISIDEDEPDRDYRIRLSVDGEYVDTADGSFAIDVSVTQSEPLVWTQVTEGEHQVEVHLFHPDAAEGDEPYRVLVVTDEDGGTLDVPGPGSGDKKDGTKDSSDSPLDVFEPINDLLPLQVFPEGARPWVVPALLLIVIFGAGFYLMGRPPKGPTGSGKSDKTRTTSETPTASKEGGSKDLTAIEFPDVSKTPESSGPVSIPYPNTGTTSHTGNNPSKVKHETEVEKEV
jgi:hypothetical protein